MARTMQSLNAEWATIVHTPRARRALMRWSAAHPVLLPAMDLDGVLELGLDPKDGPVVRSVLAAMAPTDELAARTLFQGLLGGLVKLSCRVGRDDNALDEILALGWVRVCTYPSCREGSVAGNVLLDVGKRYRRQHEQECADSPIDTTLAPGISVEDQVIRSEFLDVLFATGREIGLSNEVIDTIIRSRVDGESMADLAVEQNVSRKVLWHRRWRAEARLREFELVS